MPLKRKTLRAYMADGTEHVVTLTLADQLRGELEAKKNMIALDLPMHLATVWLWCALTRNGQYNEPFQQFLNVDCLDWEDAVPGEDDDVDPTQPAAPDGSAFSSPSPSPEPPSSSG